MMTLKTMEQEELQEEDTTVASERQKKRRSTYDEGFSPVDYKDSSVKKLIILALGPAKETHENMAIILDRLNIRHLDFSLSADIKMILLLVG